MSPCSGAYWGGREKGQKPFSRQLTGAISARLRVQVLDSGRKLLRFLPPGWWFYMIAYGGHDSLML